MRINTITRKLNIFSSLIWLLLYVLALSKFLYLQAKGLPFYHGMQGELLLILVASVLLGITKYLKNNLLRTLTVALLLFFVLLITISSISGFVGYQLTGTIPRVQQLQGLTWDIVGHSITPIVLGFKFEVIASVIAFALTWWLLYALYKKNYFFVVLPILLLSLSTFVYSIYNCLGCFDYKSFLILQQFQSDISTKEIITQEETRIEADFFNDFQSRIHSSTGVNQNYYQLLDGSNNKNIIFLVMESVRAKDFVLYGGKASMPNVEAMASNMIVFDNLYSQDVRSTKAYPSLDMGYFGLTTWDNYSFNLTRKYTEHSLVTKLTDFGYESLVYVNGSPTYDRHKEYQVFRGYHHVFYDRDINRIGFNDDLILLEQALDRIKAINKPIYTMLWPIATHHPYSRDYWADKSAWHKRNPGGIQHGSPDDYDRYLQSLSELDEFIGLLVTGLKSIGELEETIIIAVGDHGEAFGEHDSRNVFHGNDVYEESVHIPGFVFSLNIENGYREPRFIPHRDIAASILDLASGGEFTTLNDSRSIFHNYSKNIPIYLYNSWSRKKGIIYDGYKLRMGSEKNSKIYYSSIKNIRNDNSYELAEETSQDIYMQAKLEFDKWYEAMIIRSKRKLFSEDQDVMFQDILRIYCDDGNGFREDRRLKVYAPVVGGKEKLKFSKKMECQSLRVAPIQDLKPNSNNNLFFKVEGINLYLGNGTTIDLSELSLTGVMHSNIIDDNTFQINAGATMDYTIKTGLVPIDRLELNTYFFKK